MAGATGADDLTAATRLSGAADLVRPMALRVAATLRIADWLDAEPLTLNELAVATSTKPTSLSQLLRYLASIGIVEAVSASDAVVRYRLLDEGRPLLDDHPARLRVRLDIDGALGRADLAFASLLHSVRTGSPGYVDHFGQPFWVDLASAPDRHEGYDELMGADVSRWSKELVPAYDWGGLESVVDVGGGNGTLLIELLRAFPDLTGTVVEQPATAASALANLYEAGLSDRADTVGGSFFDALPTGASAYLLVAVLHNWDDAAAATILLRCREAAGRDGRVLVVERTGPGGEAPSPEMDLRGLVYFGGRERGVSDIAELAATVGLDAATAFPAGELSVVELRQT